MRHLPGGGRNTLSAGPHSSSSLSRYPVTLHCFLRRTQAVSTNVNQFHLSLTFGFKINSKGKRVRGRKTQRAASSHTTCPSGCSPNLVDGGCFSQAKIDRSACKVRLSAKHTQVLFRNWRTNKFLLATPPFSSEARLAPHDSAAAAAPFLPQPLSQRGGLPLA